MSQESVKPIEDEKENTFDARVLNVLMDAKSHTQVWLSHKFNVGIDTIYRAVKRLRKNFKILTYRGGADYGGLFLHPKHIHYYDLIKAHLLSEGYDFYRIELELRKDAEQEKADIIYHNIS